MKDGVFRRSVRRLGRILKKPFPVLVQRRSRKTRLLASFIFNSLQPMKTKKAPRAYTSHTSLWITLFRCTGHCGRKDGRIPQLSWNNAPNRDLEAYRSTDQTGARIASLRTQLDEPRPGYTRPTYPRQRIKFSSRPNSLTAGHMGKRHCPSSFCKATFQSSGK